MFQDTPSSFSDVGNQCIPKFSWNIALVRIKELQASGLISCLIKYAQYTTAVAAGTKEKPFLCLQQQVGGQGNTRCFTWKSPASTNPKCQSAELPGERWPISCRWQTKHNEIDRVESYSKKVWEANLQFWKTKITTNRGSFHCGFRGSLKRVHSQKMMKKKHLKHSSFAVEKNQNALSGHPQFLHVNLEGKIVRRMRSLLTRHRAVWLSGRSSTQNFSNSTSHAVNIHAVKIMLLDFLHDFHCDMRLYRPLRFDSPSAAHALLCGKSRWLHCSAKSLSW